MDDSPYIYSAYVSPHHVGFACLIGSHYLKWRALLGSKHLWQQELYGMGYVSKIIGRVGLVWGCSVGAWNVLNDT